MKSSISHTILICVVLLAGACDETFTADRDGWLGDGSMSLNDRGKDVSDGLKPSGPCHAAALENGRRVCLPQKRIYDSTKAPAPIKSAFPESLPSKIDFLGAYLGTTCPTVHDQGKCGWTVAHSVTAAMEAEHCKANGVEVLLSPPHLWHAGGKVVQDCTGEWSVLTAVKTAASNYLVSRTVWPYDEDVSKMASTKPTSAVLLGKGQQQIKSYFTVEPKSVVNLKTALVKGYNVIYMLPVFQGMGWSKPCSGQNWSSGDVIWKKPAATETRCSKSSKVCKKPDYSTDLSTCRCESGADCPGGLACVAGRCADGWQAVLVIGYDNAKGGWFKFKNSWGKTWGDKGYGRLSYGLVSALGQGGIFPAGLNMKTVCAKQVCTPGTSKCDASGKNTLKCRKDGCGWDLYQSCQCSCSGGACAVAALAPGTKGFYRLQSCTTSGCGGKSDELWTTTKAVSGHATYKPYFSYVHWYAPDGQ